MLADLEKRGLLENTLVIATSDNGMPFPRIKGQNYPITQQIRLPLAMMWPMPAVRKPTVLAWWMITSASLTSRPRSSHWPG